MDEFNYMESAAARRNIAPEITKLRWMQHSCQQRFELPDSVYETFLTIVFSCTDLMGECNSNRDVIAMKRYGGIEGADSIATRSTMTKHIKILENAGLIKVVRYSGGRPNNIMLSGYRGFKVKKPVKVG